MRKNVKVIQLLLMLIVTLITLVTVTFAWFIVITKTDPIIIESGSLRVNASLYIGKDTNDNKVIEEDEYVLITDEIKNLKNVLPGTIYSFKLVIYNAGSASGHLSVDMINIIYSDEVMQNSFKIVYNHPIDNIETTKFIGNDELAIFKEFVLTEKTTYSFYFRIIGSENISAEMAGHFLKLSSFLVTLDQIQE